MASRKPLVLVGGIPAVLPAGDTLVGGADEVSAWPTLVVSRNNGNDGAFQTGRFDANAANNFVTVALGGPASIDTHSGWNGSTNVYTVPQTGIYDCQGKIRLDDVTPKGISYGVGVDTSNADSPGFAWWITGAVDPALQGTGVAYNNPAGFFRHFAYNSRLMSLTAGQQVRLFTLIDSVSNVGINKAELSLTRVR